MLANPERIACAFWLSRKKFFGPLHHLEWYGAALDRCYNPETDLLFSGSRVHGGSIPFCRNLRKSALLPLSTPLPRISYRLGKNRSASHQLLPFLTKSPDAIFCAPGSFSVHRKPSDSQRRRFIMNIGIDHGYSAVKTRHFPSQPVSPLTPTNRTRCRTRWSTAGSILSAAPADSQSFETKQKTAIIIS